MTVNVLLLLALSFAWASEFLFIRRADAALPPLTVTAAMVAIGALALFIYVGLVRRREQPALATILGPGLVWVAAAGVVSMAFAYLGYFALIERAGATFASLYAYLVPVASLLLGVVLADETLTTQHLAGLALVLTGLWMIARGGERVAPSARKPPTG